MGRTHRGVARPVRGMVVALGFACGACTNLVGLTGYSTRGDSSSSEGGGAALGDAASGTDAQGTNEAGCDDDSSVCYACTPTTAEQLLNACTNATCVPFDDTGRLTHLLPDGSLPPLPPLSADAGH
jgi:hypothetical protein